MFTELRLCWTKKRLLFSAWAVKKERYLCSCSPPTPPSPSVCLCVCLCIFVCLFVSFWLSCCVSLLQAPPWLVWTVWSAPRRGSSTPNPKKTWWVLGFSSSRQFRYPEMKEFAAAFSSFLSNCDVIVTAVCVRLLASSSNRRHRRRSAPLARHRMSLPLALVRFQWMCSACRSCDLCACMWAHVFVYFSFGRLFLWDEAIWRWNDQTCDRKCRPQPKQ